MRSKILNAEPTKLCKAVVKDSLGLFNATIDVVLTMELSVMLTRRDMPRLWGNDRQRTNQLL